MQLTFVIPVYNEAPTLEALAEGILEHAGTDDLEILFVDDGSADDSPRVVRGIAQDHAAVRLISLDKHEGKTAALALGFAQAVGQIIVTMDSDGQDDPAEIQEFLSKLDEGYDLVCGWKRNRKDPRSRVWASSVYNAAVRSLFGISLHDVNCGFRAMRHEIIDSIPMKRDYHRLIPVLAHRAGYRVAEVEVLHHPRGFGKSKYGLTRYLRAVRDIASLLLFG